MNYNLEREIGLKTRNSENITRSTIEKDYVLSWMLYGISKTPLLKESLIFKGGTALKKCYFGDYRFSVDLDFSVRGKFPHGDKLEELIMGACTLIEEELDTRYRGIKFQCQRYTENQPHPENQEAFTIRAQLPWHREPHANIKIEITTQEKVVLNPEIKQIIHDYEPNFRADVNCYPIDEIILEKLRAILQYTKKIHEKSWARSRARDYYDLWNILNKYAVSLSRDEFNHFLKMKCAPKGVQFESADDFFDKEVIRIVEDEWQQWLGNLLDDLPSSEIVIKELKQKLVEIL